MTIDSQRSGDILFTELVSHWWAIDNASDAICNRIVWEYPRSGLTTRCAAQTADHHASIPDTGAR